MDKGRALEIRHIHRGNAGGAETLEHRVGKEAVLALRREGVGGESMRREQLRHLRRIHVEILPTQREHVAEGRPAFAGIDQEPNGVDVQSHDGCSVRTPKLKPLIHTNRR